MPVYERVGDLTSEILDGDQEYAIIHNVLYVESYRGDATAITVPIID